MKSGDLARIWKTVKLEKLFVGSFQNSSGNFQLIYNGVATERIDNIMTEISLYDLSVYITVLPIFCDKFGGL